jgi:type I restriction-modification system DNA methylase subunit
MSSINNRFISDSTFLNIQKNIFTRVHEDEFEFQRFQNVRKALTTIYNQIPTFRGHNEASPESVFVPLLEEALEMSFYSKPQVQSIGKIPDFSASSNPKNSYMNLYLRDKNKFWEQTNFLLEVKPVGFDIEGHDPTTGMSWIEKCGWLCKESGVPFGILTNFQKWYIVRYSEENELKYISMYPDGFDDELEILHLVEDDNVSSRLDIEHLAKIITLLTSDKLEDYKNEFLDIDNEELDIADKLLPRFLDSISMLMNENKSGNDEDMQLRIASIFLFSLWSSMSESELVASDKFSQNSVTVDLIGNLKKYLLSEDESILNILKIDYEVALENSHNMLKQVVASMPRETAKHYDLNYIPNISFEDFLSVTAILFLDMNKNKIDIRGSHKLGAASISTIFEGILAHNVELGRKNESMVAKYWSSTLGTCPKLLTKSKTKYKLVLPKSVTKRKKLGAYFTPTSVCNYLIDGLDFSSVDSSHPLAIDPTCGTGQFLMSFLRLLSINLNDDVVVDELISSVVGNDVEPVALFITSYRVNSFFLKVFNKTIPKQKIKLYCYNFTDEKQVKRLKKKTGEVDFVIGNPPFGADTNQCKLFSNTWQSCLNNSINFSENIGYGIVLPVSLCTSSAVSSIRDQIISESSTLKYLAFDTRPSPIFRDVDQRILLINGDTYKKENEENVDMRVLCGGYRRHKSTNTLSQSMSNAEWLTLDVSEFSGIFPLPNIENEYEVYQSLLSESKDSKLLKKGNYKISVMSYGRYNINAVLGDPPSGAGKKWKKFYFDDELSASLTVLFLNSHIGWNIFRMITNGLDFNNRVVQLISSTKVNRKSHNRIINSAKNFTTIMNKSYEEHGEFKLSGRIKLFSDINKIVASIFNKKVSISSSQCSDPARIRVLEGRKVA